MINTFEIYNELRESIGDNAAKKMAEVLFRVYEELTQAVTKKEFNELRVVVHELGEAQKRTEARVEELAEAQKRTEARVEELAEAQRKTESRLDALAGKVEELTEAQRKTESRLDALAGKVEELAEAQRKTESRLDALAGKVEELAEAQRKTESRLDALAGKVEELAEAQRKTEKELAKLAFEHRKTREQLGGLAHTVGYRLEDEAIWALPHLLKRDFGLIVIGTLKRTWLEISEGKYIELNVWGDAERNGQRVVILGEAKTQLKKRDVDSFCKTVEKIKDLTGKEIFPVLITYQSSPKVIKLAEERGIKLYFSYELKV